MKKIVIIVLIGFFTLSSCNKEDENITPETETNCSCNNELEFICWKLNGVSQTPSIVGKTLTDSLLNQGYFNFGDNSGSGLYFEYEDIPTPILLNTVYEINESTSSDYDISYYGGTNDIDTFFLSATITFTENTSSYLKGEFTAKDAITSDISGNVVDSIDLEITNGCFKLLK